MTEIVAQMAYQIEQGERLSDACARHSRVFSRFYIHLLRVGEAIGALHRSLEQLTDTIVKRKAMGDKVKGVHWSRYPSSFKATGPIFWRLCPSDQPATGWLLRPRRACGPGTGCC